MTPASGIVFPFLRETPHLLGELKAFEADLHEKRLNNLALSNELRAPITGSPDWIALRNKELIPLIYYANHMNVSDSARFIIAPHGHPGADIRLYYSGETENLQMTTAYADWRFLDANVPTKHGGHLHRRETEILNREGIVGWGPLTESNGKLSQERRMVSTVERDPAHFNGLVQALVNKFKKKCEPECTLLVLAVGYFEGGTREWFERLACSAVSTARKQVSQPNWIKRICILDQGFCIDSG
ncbi:hypothetical protein [Methylocystis sp. SC2]|uniref:hypothetical protein n=1 Tax=Methylocystis sp. (strain SC2) TaxID=187303 RepID=UPI00027AEF1B|nr:hypothetical protein [Methylocystis sp. SC2]CCJ07009.1 Hypothetical protein BN69_1558 [Methylocystis sp. SC2]